MVVAVGLSSPIGLLMITELKTNWHIRGYVLKSISQPKLTSSVNEEPKVSNCLKETRIVTSLIHDSLGMVVIKTFLVLLEFTILLHAYFIFVSLLRKILPYIFNKVSLFTLSIKLHFWIAPRNTQSRKKIGSGAAFELGTKLVAKSEARTDEKR